MATATNVYATPTQARQWLATQKANRPISKTTVIKYRDDMTNGRWLYTGEPIKFNYRGELIDGQHRLQALAKAPKGTRIEFLIISGLSNDAQYYLDQGRKRTASNQLALKGIRGYATIAAGVREKLMLDPQNLRVSEQRARQTISNAKVLEWVDNNKNLCNTVGKHVKHMRDIDIRPAILCAFALEVFPHSPGAAIKFFSELHNGPEAGAGYPLTTLLKRAKQVRRTHQPVPDRDWYQWIVKTWNAWMAGKQLRILPSVNNAWTVEDWKTASRGLVS